MAKGLALRVSKASGVRVVCLKEANPRPELKVITHLNDMGDHVAVFSRDHSQVNSIIEMERIMAGFIDGINETYDGFYQLFFSKKKSWSYIVRAIHRLKGVNIRIDEREDVFECYPAIPIVDGVTIDA